MRQSPELIFVYNADSSLISQVGDFFKKTFDPQNYECNLCMVTYGLAREKKRWGNFINSLDIKSRFLHRDEFKRKFPKYKREKLPAIFVKRGENLEEVIPASVINKVESVPEMVDIVSSKLTKLN